jgi:hypothetical protein
MGAQSSVPGPETGRINARIFLGLYMCMYYPDKVFDGQNRDLEENLIQHATNVCRSFNMLCAYVQNDGYLRLDRPLVKQQALGFVDKVWARAGLDLPRLGLPDICFFRAAAHALPAELQGVEDSRPGPAVGAHLDSIF